MKIFAISDLHLAISCDKPMDIFGGSWENYIEKIKADWLEKVSDDDIVIVAGDISWAMKLEDFKKDLVFFQGLPGKIVMVRGNHDYWWSSVSKVRSILPENMFVLQNDAIKFGKYIFCGSRDWDLPNNSSDDEDIKIYQREKIRIELALKSAKNLQTNAEKIILVTHYPPYSPQNKDTDMVRLINCYDVSCVVFGHVHKDLKGLKLTQKIEKTEYFLTSCDLLDNKIIQIVP